MTGRLEKEHKIPRETARDEANQMCRNNYPDKSRLIRENAV